MSLPSLKIHHKKPYPAISPSRKELSQAGRTVLITGGGGGIGLATAEAFITAGASKVIIVGRRKAVLDGSVAKLQAQAKGTTVEGHVADVGSLESTAALWDALAKAGTHVDVLVLNAAVAGQDKPLLDQDLATVWHDYEIHVRGLLDYIQRFHKQPGYDSKKHYLINVSTVGSYLFQYGQQRPSYGITKNSGTLLVQQLARAVPVDKTQIISYHPGAVQSEGATNADANFPNPDDASLPAHYAVWAASDEAAFLHGRFTWANWDIDEIRQPGPDSVQQRIKDDIAFLTVGIDGLPATAPLPPTMF